MHLPAPSPPLRGLLLRLVSRLVMWAPIRDLVLRKVRKDAGIPQLPEPGARP
jgi:hypothetical protein